MTTNDANVSIRELLRKAFETYADADPSDPDYESRLFDFQFHMTDGLDDVIEFGWALFQPGAPPTKQAILAVYNFLIHAVPHLMAAHEALHGEPLHHPFTPTPSAKSVNGTPARSKSTRRTRVKK
jgi:hypothetical protein